MIAAHDFVMHAEKRCKTQVFLTRFHVSSDLYHSSNAM
jgi:hypothetical protein